MSMQLWTNKIATGGKGYTMGKVVRAQEIALATMVTKQTQKSVSCTPLTDATRNQKRLGCKADDLRG